MTTDTTSVKLPPKLKARVAALARKSGRSAHSFIVEAVERHAEREERLRRFVQEALVGGDVNPRKFGVERRIRRERDQDRRRGERRRGLG